MVEDGTYMEDIKEAAASALKPYEQEILLDQDDLRASLQVLERAAMDMEARLDQTYASILAKYKNLDATVEGLKELSTLARQLNSDFATETEGITRELQEKIESFEGFAAQEEELARLQNRIAIAQEKVNQLAERVEKVRHKAEAWSRVEAAWEEKTRRRIKLFWGLSAAFLLVLVAILGYQYTPRRTLSGVEKGFNVYKGSDIPGQELDLLNESLGISRHRDEVLEKLRKGGHEQAEDDPRLRVFDEL